MRTVLILLLLLLTSIIQNRRRHKLQEIHRRKSVLELDFKTPRLGFLPFSEDNQMIWSVYHLYIFYKRLTHLSIYKR